MLECIYWNLKVDPLPAICSLASRVRYRNRGSCSPDDVRHASTVWRRDGTERRDPEQNQTARPGVATLDLLDEVRKRLGFRLGMGHLAKETLGCDKSADGLQSLEWVRQGRLDLVEAYCRKDVEILRDLFLHGRREGCLYYRRRGQEVKLRLPVEW